MPRNGLEKNTFLFIFAPWPGRSPDRSPKNRMPNIPADFNPDDPGVANGRYFGLPFEADDAELVILPVPWEVTTSYGAGTSRGPQAMLEASLQIDLCDEHYPEGWKRGIGTLEPEAGWETLGKALRLEANEVIDALSEGEDIAAFADTLERINAGCARLNEDLYQTVSRRLEAGQTVGVLGGDHSVPLGAIRACAERHPGLGILHLDAHADLREAYEGFTYSHASIMYNALREAPDIASLVQVAVRDQGARERRLAQTDSRIHQYTDAALAAARFEGKTWETLCAEIISALPQEVYVSFDIDALSPSLCPHTGTPVPGGLEFQEAVYLLRRLVDSGRRIAGFDLCEVSPGEDEWDANVGARVLYKLSNLALLSQR